MRTFKQPYDAWGKCQRCGTSVPPAGAHRVLRKAGHLPAMVSQVRRRARRRDVVGGLGRGRQRRGGSTRRVFEAGTTMTPPETESCRVLDPADEDELPDEACAANPSCWS